MKHYSPCMHVRCEENDPDCVPRCDCGKGWENKFDSKFDYLYARHTLDQWEDYKIFIREVEAAAREEIPPGQICLTDANFKVLVDEIKQKARHEAITEAVACVPTIESMGFIGTGGGKPFNDEVDAFNTCRAETLANLQKLKDTQV